jgi:Tol biopolymer transport system component
VTNDTNSYSQVSLTADGETLLGSQVTTVDSLWTAELSGNGNVQVSPVDLGVGNYDSPIWTTGGRLLYIYGPGFAPPELWLSDTSGSQRRPVSGFPAGIVEPACSSDGHVVVFVQASNGYRNIWLGDLEGGGLTRLTAGLLDLHPQPSPNGKWVVYASKVAGRWGIWKASTDGRVPPVKLDDSPETDPSISPDSTLVVYEQADPVNHEVKMVVRSLDDGKLRYALPLPKRAGNIRWQRDGRALTFLAPAIDSTQIWAQPLSGGAPTLIGQGLPPDLKRMDWSWDGKRIVCLRRRLRVNLVLAKDFR